MADQPIRPGRWLYGVAAVMAVAGVVVVVVGVGSFIHKMTGLGSDFQRVVAPGAGTITLPEPGKYTIYHEYVSVVGGRAYSNPQGLSGLSCSVKRVDGAQEVPVRSTVVSANYQAGGRSGVAVWEFEIDTPGQYEVSAGYADEATSPQVVLAVGRPIMKGLAGSILGFVGGICGVVLLVGGALAIFIVTLVKRSSAKKRLAAAPPEPAKL